MKRVSIADLAADLGISATSVSFALRGRPGVSEALRARVVAHAEKVGYRPNTVAQELMSLVRSSRVSAHADTIAFVNTFRDPSLLRRVEGFRQFLEGAERRARDYGFKVEEFRAHAPGMNPARLEKILLARGVRGILLGPRWQTDPQVEFDWTKFSAVLVGEAFSGPNISRVCNDHVHSTETTLEKLAGLGYQRVGVALLDRDEKVRGFDYLLGVEQFRRHRGRSPRVSTLLFESFDPAELRSWVKREQLDAVVSLTVEPWDVVKQLKAPDGRPVGYANLSVRSGTPWAGIEQHYDQVAATGVDLLRAQMLSGERGTQPLTKILLVRGVWRDGPSAPPRR
jgi:LacI family transcriptional regulator